MRKLGVPIKLLRNPVHFMSLGFGSGLSPLAPGTAGTLMAIPVFLFLYQFEFIVYCALVLVALVIGFYCTGKTGKVLGVTDHGAIVWDEFVGYFITMAVLPLNSIEPVLTNYPLIFWVVCGFVFFRFFDILKPWPIKRMEHVFPGGYGVMLDDVMAGIYAAICLQLLIHILK